MNPNDLKCRAMDLNGNVVEGWYVNVLGAHEIYNDDIDFPECRVHVDPATLELCSEPVLKVKPKEIMDYWNDKDTLSPKVNAMSDARKRHLIARCKEPDFVRHWKEIIDYMASEKFYYEQRWCSFDLVIKNNASYNKVIELMKHKKQPVKQTQSLSALERAKRGDTHFNT